MQFSSSTSQSLPADVSLGELIQQLVTMEKTCHLRLLTEAGNGEIYFHSGRVVHARCGAVVGPEAIVTMLGALHVRYAVDSQADTGLHTIPPEWQESVLEAAKQQHGAVARPGLEEPPAGRWKRRGLAFGGGVALLGGVALVAFMMLSAGKPAPTTPAPAPAASAPYAAAASAPASAPTVPGSAPAPAAPAAPIKATPEELAAAVEAGSLGPNDSPPTVLAAAVPRLPASAGPLTPTIVCRVLVGADGRPRDAVVRAPRPDLAAFEEAALTAVRAYRFAPGQRAGAPVAVWLSVPISFAGAAPAEPVTIQIKGSDTIGGELGPALGAAFTAAVPEVKIQEEALGSGTAFVGLFDGSAVLGASSRPINDKELAEASRLGIKLQEFVIGYDGIAVIVSPKNKVASLSLDQLAQLFSGQVRNWKDVGGADAPVHLYGRPSYSGTFGFFRDKVVRHGNAKGPEDFAADTKIIEKNEQLVPAVAADADGIGYVGLGWLAPAVRAVPVAAAPGQPPVAPSTETVQNSSYPIFRPLLFYTRGAPTGAVAAFLRFVLSPSGRAQVEKFGFVAAETPAETMASLAESAASRSDATTAPPAVRVLFAAGARTPDALGRKALDDVASTLATHPAMHVILVGNADSEGGRQANEYVAAERAKRVAEYLKAHGVASERVQVDAAGTDRPLASNTTGAGRSQNRRVDVFFVSQ
jgi:phosphate binding protein